MKKFLSFIPLIVFILFMIFSQQMDFSKGIEISVSFKKIFLEMLKILPCAFILIGLFEVWVKKETVMKHLGEDSKFLGYLWALILAGFSVGGLYVAFPIAQSLHKKGASLKIIFSYLGFAGIVRIPMTIFELSFLGLPFTLLRLAITIPAFLLIGILFGTLLKKSSYKFYESD